MDRAHACGTLYATAVGTAVGLALIGRPNLGTQSVSAYSVSLGERESIVGPHAQAAQAAEDWLDAAGPILVPLAISDGVGALPGGNQESDASPSGIDEGWIGIGIERARQTAMLARRTIRAPLGIASAAGKVAVRPTARWLDAQTAELRTRMAWYLVGASMAMDDTAACDPSEIARAYWDELTSPRELAQGEPASARQPREPGESPRAESRAESQRPADTLGYHSPAHKTRRPWTTDPWEAPKGKLRDWIAAPFLLQ